MHMLRAMELRQRIFQARSSAGLTQQGLAEAVKKTRGAVAQWESGEVRPRHATLVSIASATGVPLEWLVSGVDAERTGLWVVGIVSAGTWREEDFNLKPQTKPVAPHPDFPAHAQRLYRVEGTSVNRVVEDGAYIHAVSILDADVAPTPGDLVIVERRRHGTIEYTAKRYLVEDGRQILRPESDDPRWQTDIELNGDDDTEIVITAIAIAEWKPIRRL